jgi:hypothetical protein
MNNKFVMDPAASLDTQVVPVRGRVVKSKWARNLLTFLMVLGSGLIVMVADNDAGAVSTYSQAGAQYGTHLDPFLPPTKEKTASHRTPKTACP